MLSFLKVAEMGNFTKAAEELGYAQSTVTTQIQQLEQEIGFPLFEHIGRRNVLTSEGMQVKAYAKGILELEAQIRNVGCTDTHSLKGSIRVGIVESLIHSLLLNVIRDYCSDYPMITIQIVPGVTAQLFEMLRHNEVDIIITMGEQTSEENCLCAVSHQENAVFIAAADHPLVHAKDLALTRVFDEPLILTGDDTFLQRQLRRIAAECGREVNWQIQTRSAQTIVSLVQAGLGISFLPEYLARSPLLQGRIAILPVLDFAMPFYVHVFHHKNKWLTPQILGMLEAIRIYWGIQDQIRDKKI